MVGKPLSDDDEGRDWLWVQSGITSGADDDISMLHDFLRGKPLLAPSEVREIIGRILHNHDPLGVGKYLISMLFDPARTPKGQERPVWTVDFKRASKGQPNPWRDTRMALAIQACRECGKSYDEAIAWAVESFGIGERRAKQIYSKRKDKITKLRVRSVKSDS